MAKSLVAALNGKSTDAQFAAAAASIFKRATSVQTDIHLYLLAAVYRWKETGDMRPAVKHINALIDEMPVGVRVNAIREYVEKMLGFQYSDEHKAFVHSKAKVPDADKFKRICGCYWYDFKKEPEYKGMDLEASIRKLLDDATKRAKEPNAADNIDTDLLAALRKATLKVKEDAIAH